MMEARGTENEQTILLRIYHRKLLNYMETGARPDPELEYR